MVYFFFTSTVKTQDSSIGPKIQPVIASFSAGEFRPLPALSDNPDFKTLLHLFLFSCH